MCGVLCHSHDHGHGLGLGPGLGLLSLVIYKCQRLQDPLFSLYYIQEGMDVCAVYSFMVIVMVKVMVLVWVIILVHSPYHTSLL